MAIEFFGTNAIDFYFGTNGTDLSFWYLWITTIFKGPLYHSSTFFKKSQK